MDTSTPSELRSGGGNSSGGGALQATLGIATSAANLVLYPYVVAGKAAYSATSYAVHAPIKITRHVKDSILGASSEQSDADSIASACDLFGERSSSDSEQDETHSRTEEGALDDGDDGNATDLFGERFATVIDASDASDSNAPADVRSSGVVSQLLFLPVRLVSTSVSTAVALPGSIISYSGRTISGAASSSKALATTALVVSSSAVARTSLNVAQGLTSSALSTVSFTASTLTGAVGTSVRTVGYVVPTSVSNAVWQSVGATGSASVSVVSYAIAVPAYRMLAALVPDLAQFVSERDCVERTREVVLLLVRTLGPQNAFYLLKFVYETVNSDEAYDLFLLCHDVVRESLDRENYKRLGASVGDATGVRSVVSELFSMLPSADELFDAFVFVADVSDEVVESLFAPLSAEDSKRRQRSNSSSGSGSGSGSDCDASSSRFTYVNDDDDDLDDDHTTASDSSSDDDGGIESICSRVVISTDTFELEPLASSGDDGGNDTNDDEEDNDTCACDATLARSASVDTAAAGISFAFAASESSSLLQTPDVVDAGVALLAKACDSDAASLLFNTFGDFLDVLMD